MRALHFAWLASLVLASCSANSGAPERADNDLVGVGGGPPSNVTTCAMEVDGCAGCLGCVTRCVCMTDNVSQCPAACGVGGAPPPPDPPPGGGGSGGSPPDPPPDPPSTGGEGGAGANPCTYPVGPYGTKVGSTLSPELAWQGYPEDQNQPSTLSTQDYFDCDGTRGINAILITEGAVWCGSCKAEAKQLNGWVASTFAPKGIRVLSLIIEDGYGMPATIQTAEAWKNAFNAKGWAVAADPAFTFATSGSNGLPVGIVIDPRTMKVVDRREGMFSESKLLQVANANGAK